MRVCMASMAWHIQGTQRHMEGRERGAGRERKRESEYICCSAMPQQHRSKSVCQYVLES